MPDRSNLVYRYDGTYQGFLCCVAQCFFHKKLPQGVQLLDEPQGTLFGVQAVEGCRNAFQRVSEQMMSGFSPEELEQLAQFQRRMLNNLLNSQPKE